MASNQHDFKVGGFISSVKFVDMSKEEAERLAKMWQFHKCCIREAYIITGVRDVYEITTWQCSTNVCGVRDEEPNPEVSPFLSE